MICGYAPGARECESCVQSASRRHASQAAILDRHDKPKGMVYMSSTAVEGTILGEDNILQVSVQHENLAPTRGAFSGRVRSWNSPRVCIYESLLACISAPPPDCQTSGSPMISSSIMKTHGRLMLVAHITPGDLREISNVALVAAGAALGPASFHPPCASSAAASKEP